MSQLIRATARAGFDRAEDYARGTIGRKMVDLLSIGDCGAVGDGVTDDTAAFNTAAALGRRILLQPGATYLISSRVTLATGSAFVCTAGFAKVRFKTGAGGFNSTDLTADKNAAGRCGFLADTIDDVALEGIEFEPDGVAPVVIYPVRVRAGMAARGFRAERLRFSGFPICNGGLLAMGSLGAGSYRVRDIEARSCGTSSTAWTGTPQITVVEVDNDMVGGTPSEPGRMKDISGIDIAFTGAALAAYGQQTDVVNIAGVSGTDRKGPFIDGVYGQNVGEVVDLFCSHAIVRGVRGRDVYNFCVKLIHGARFNDIELETIENWGAAAVTFQGSAAIAINTEHNHVRVGSARQGAAIGAFGDVPVVLFGANGGGPATCLPKNNVCTVGAVFGDGVNLDYVVRDGSAANGCANLVEVVKATGWLTGFCSAPPGNVTVRYRQNTRTLLTVGAAQALVTATWTKVAVDTVGADTDGGGDTVNNRVRCRFPGPKLVRGSIRVGVNAGDDIELRLMLNGAQVAYAAAEPQSGGLAYVYTIAKVVYIDESAAGLAAADLTLEARITSAGAISINNLAAASYLEVTDLG